MLNIFKNKKGRVVVWNSVLIVIGLLFCFLPNSAVSVLETICFVFLIAYGVYCLAGYVLAPDGSKDTMLLYESFFYVFAGIFLSFIENLFIIAIGIYLLFQGMIEIYYASELKKNGEKNWYTDALMGLVVAVLGIVVLVLCKKTLTILSILMGIAMVIYGVTNLIRIFVMNRNFYEVKILSKEESNIIREVQELQKTEENDNHDDTNNKDDDFQDYNIK